MHYLRSLEDNRRPHSQPKPARSGGSRPKLAALVAERQALRERGASPIELERNRRSIVGCQRELARTLGAFYGAGGAHPRSSPLAGARRRSDG